MKPSVKTIGVKFLNEIPPVDLPVPEVRSWCEGLGNLVRGEYPEGYLVTAESIGICVWSLVALGFRGPTNRIEESPPIRYDEETKAIFVFNAGMDPEGHPMADAVRHPDVVTILAPQMEMERIVMEFGPEALDTEFLGNRAFSANDRFLSETTDGRMKKKLARRERSIRVFNRLFGSRPMQSRFVDTRMTAWMKQRWMQSFINYFVLNHTTAFAMCFSTVAYPREKGKANVTFIDMGAIGWGKMDPDLMAIGIPGEIYTQTFATIGA